jgi:hypothetical protein
VIDQDVEHPGHRPGELHDLVDDEAHVPIDGLADRPLDVAPHHLLGLDGDRDVDICRAVDQGEGLAEARLAVQADRGELEEQLVELLLEPGGKVARCPPPPDLGVDLGHHLVEVLRATFGVDRVRPRSIVVGGRHRRRGGRRGRHNVTIASAPCSLREHPGGVGSVCGCGISRRRCSRVV